ncbi:2Fe-2S iron-sulfur cluster-binding protein [Emcibacter sp.]|uniref:2Fe-2S iron-sulfur cluster-binding protein n=1 Tax=Emcibacter sp. TaxID=1979954 RepID=UPI002AA7BE86|nr:2Fe-2S iron-sulfur cluster-binding protein [Emcibacter sp.]
MINIHVTQLDGTQITLSAKKEGCLMDALRDAGIDGIDAICGGACSCATCHVRLSDDWYKKLPVNDGNEEELLADSDHRTGTSRLSCQIQLSEELDGLRLQIAEPD